MSAVKARDKILLHHSHTPTSQKIKNFQIKKPDHKNRNVSRWCINLYSIGSQVLPYTGTEYNWGHFFPPEMMVWISVALISAVSDGVKILIADSLMILHLHFILTKTFLI